MCTQVPKDDGGVFPVVFKLSCGDPFCDLMRYVSCLTSVCSYCLVEVLRGNLCAYVEGE